MEKEKERERDDRKTTERRQKGKGNQEAEKVRGATDRHGNDGEEARQRERMEKRIE